MIFKVLFWNIWLDNQINGETAAKPLLSELDRVIDHYQPDIIGLNEVLRNQGADQPFVTDFLERSHDYKYSHYAPASPLNDEWLIGTALYSRHKFDMVDAVTICEDSPAEKRGFPDHNVKAITATLSLGTQQRVNVIVAHPLHLRLYSLNDHYAATKKLNDLVRSKQFNENTILGGDFNEPDFMPRAFKNKVNDHMYFKTGSLAMPTWRHNAYPFTPVRANLDQLYWTKQSSFKLIDFTVIDTSVSDHRPIFATFEF